MHDTLYNLELVREKLDLCDPDVFTEVVHKETKALTTYARDLVGDDLAQDVVQEVWLHAWMKRHEYDGNPKLIRWWLCRFAYYYGLKIQREEARQRHYHLFPAEPDPKEPVEDVVLCSLVAEFVQGLPPKQEQAVRLWSLGYTYKEIAGQMNISVSAATSNVSLARKKLHELLN